MPVRHGTSTPSTFKYGSSQVNKLYHGSNLVWSDYVPMTVMASPSSVIGIATRAAPAAANVNVTTNNTVITVSGGR